MEQNLERLDEFVLQRGRELFGDSFIVESNENHLPKMIVKKIMGEHEDISLVEMYIMRYPDETEVFVSDGGGFLREEAIRVLQEEKTCSFGIRNNRVGIREKYVTSTGEWLRVNHFCTEKKESVELFLSELCEFRKSTRKDLRYPEVKQQDFCAVVWKMVNNIFNSGLRTTFKTEYFPSFDTQDKNNYALFTIWLRLDFFVQVRIFPNYQEFVCKNPGRYWWRDERSRMSTEMSKRYDDKMIEYEKELQNELSKIDERCVMVRRGDRDFPYMQIGEVRTSNPKVVECLCKFMHQKRELDVLRQELNKDADYLERKENYLHFY